MERVESGFTPFLLKILLLYLLIFFGYMRKDKSVDVWFKDLNNMKTIPVDTVGIASTHLLQHVADTGIEQKSRTLKVSFFLND